MRQQPGRKVSRRARRRGNRPVLGRMRRRAARGSSAGSGWARRANRRGCAAGCWPRFCSAWPWCLTRRRVRSPGRPRPRAGPAAGAGSVPSMIRWTAAARVVARGLRADRYGAGVGPGLRVGRLRRRRRRHRPDRVWLLAKSGALEWNNTLTGFPAGAAIVSVRTWPGEVTAGVSYGPRAAPGSSMRTEVVISDAAGVPTGRYPAATFGGAVAGSPQYTVIVGATAVTSYDNATGRIRWQRPTGQVAQAWRTDGNWLYVAESAGGFLGRLRSPRCARSTWRPGRSCRSGRSRAFVRRHAQRRLRRRGAVLLGGRGDRVQRHQRSLAVVHSRGGARGQRPAKPATGSTSPRARTSSASTR